MNHHFSLSLGAARGAHNRNLGLHALKEIGKTLNS